MVCDIKQPPNRKKLRRLVHRWRAIVDFEEYWLRWVEPPESEPGNFYWAAERQVATGNVAKRWAAILKVETLACFDSWPEADRFLTNCVAERLGDYSVWKLDPSGAVYNLEFALQRLGLAFPGGGDRLQALEAEIGMALREPREEDFSIL